MLLVRLQESKYHYNALIIMNIFFDEKIYTNKYTNNFSGYRRSNFQACSRAPLERNAARVPRLNLATGFETRGAPSSRVLIRRASAKARPLIA